MYRNFDNIEVTGGGPNNVQVEQGFIDLEIDGNELMFHINHFTTGDFDVLLEYYPDLSDEEARKLIKENHGSFENDKSWKLDDECDLHDFIFEEYVNGDL
ncbi:MAG: hypothetical protein GF317_24530 [Candidatus Lokiarchaeota archaeon]|nr:hypothetical protein [Candidatus Lokiarchaeota archaeon]